MFSLADLGLQPAILADPDVGEHLTQRFVTPLERAGTPGRVILETVERYLANDGRLEVTAGELCVHVNTVRYRLNRFEELTSCSLRRTEDLVVVWWALARRRLTRT
jgi:DNA-binding PucR family transcriptional regulator